MRAAASASFCCSSSISVRKLRSGARARLPPASTVSPRAFQKENAALAGGGAQGVDGSLADAARRRVQNAQEGHIVVGKHGEAHIGQGVLDFGALVKAEAAEQAVAHSAGAKSLFKGAGLRVGAVEHGVRAAESSAAASSATRRGDIFGFGAGVAGFVKDEILPGPRVAASSLPMRREFLATTAAAASRIFWRER